MTRKKTEREAKLRFLFRLLISYNDFQQASWIASYILDHKFEDKVRRLRGTRRYRIKLLWQALNCAMVVSYCRPFSSNDRRAAVRIPDLPTRFLKALSREERKVHAVAMQDRNQLLAHSDSEAWNLRPFFLKSGGDRKTLVSLHNDVRAPLIHEAVELLRASSGKLKELVFEERMRLEKELEDLLPSQNAAEIIGEAQIEGLFNGK